MEVKIKRAEDLVSYQVPDKAWTIMDVLEYITLNIDPTLAYYNHSTCRQGICARCLVKANGKVVLACTERAVGEILVLEPANERVVRDLVTR